MYRHLRHKAKRREYTAGAMKLLVQIVVSLGLGIALGAPAHAGSIVIEAHVGARPKAFGETLAPVFDELAKREYQSGYQDVGRRFETAGSAPNQGADGLPADFADQLDNGYRLWITGRFKDCVGALAPLTEQAHGLPIAVATNTKVSTALFRGLVALALCHHRLGDDTAASAAMAELLRSFDGDVTKGQFGSEAFTLFTEVRQDFKDAPKGGLVVRSAEPTAAIFINERFAKVGEVNRADLIPGRYRVFAQLGKDYGRVYAVDVKAGSKTELVLDPGFERLVVTSPGWTGLSFRDRTEREQREVEMAARFGAALNAIGVVIVGTDVRNQHTVVYGALINATTGKEIRRGSVVIDNLPPPERLRALARFLTGDQAEAGIDVHEVSEVTTAQAAPIDSAHHPTSSTPRRWGGWKWLATGSAAAGLGGGIALFVLDGDCATQPPNMQVCRDLYRTKNESYVALGAGAVFAAVATWLWLSDGGSASSRKTSLWLAPTDGGAFAGVQLHL
jgi:hypothetical protein